MSYDDANHKRRWNKMEATKPIGGAYGWIQWKGTSVCMDVHCVCGASGHVDAEFAYKYRCRDCDRLFDIAGYVRLVEVPEEDITEDDRSGLSVVSGGEDEK